MAQNNDLPGNDDVYEVHEVAPKGERIARLSSWLKTKKGKAIAIVSSALILVGATAAAGVVGSNLATSGSQSPQFGNQPRFGDSDRPHLGEYPAPGKDFGKPGPGFEDRDGDHAGLNPNGDRRPDGDHDGFKSPNGGFQTDDENSETEDSESDS